MENLSSVVIVITFGAIISVDAASKPVGYHFPKLNEQQT